MAKDAKGHGSEKRGGSDTPGPRQQGLMKRYGISQKEWDAAAVKNQAAKKKWRSFRQG